MIDNELKNARTRILKQLNDGLINVQLNREGKGKKEELEQGDADVVGVDAVSSKGVGDVEHDKREDGDQEGFAIYTRSFCEEWGKNCASILDKSLD